MKPGKHEPKKRWPTLMPIWSPRMTSTLGQVIPPSIVLVILGDQMGISVGQLFLGSFIPGFMLAGVFVIYVAVIAFLRPKVAPALPEEVRQFPPKVLAVKVVRSLVPPLFLILIVLGSIFFGIATPPEAGAAGAIGAMLLALINRKLNLDALRSTMRQTVQLTSMVFIILVGATAFSMVFTALHGDLLVDNFLVNLPGGKWGFLFFTMLTVFILGFFIDFIEITFIVVPLITPIAAHFFGADMLLWFGVVIAMNLQSSFLTPPFGFALFYLKGVAPPEIGTAHIYKGIIPFVIIQILALLLLVLVPGIVNWLPSFSNAG